MKKFEKFLKNNGIYLLIGFCFLLGLVLLKFRNPTLDDDLYLLETTIMTEALSRGEWIGYYGVGIHGFLFKLPMALLFFLTGSSLIVATIWNILLSCAALYLFYIFLKKYFSNSLIPLAGTILLFTNFQFILSFPTYMREIPVILSLILFLYFVISKKSYWLISLALLLILDAKETVFFMILPSYLLYILISSWFGFNLKTFKGLFQKYYKILFAPIAYILIMIFTSIIPLNTVLFTVVPGVTEGGIEHQLSHFKIEFAIENLFRRKDPESKTIVDVIPIPVEDIPETPKTFLGYIGKLLYPRSFSFLSIPKILFFPALFTSILFFKNASRKKDEIFVILALVLWSFFVVFVLRSSYDRYLFPISGVVFFFFLVFLKEVVKTKKHFFTIVAIASLLSMMGLVFETEYVLVKLCLNLAIILAYILYLFFHKKIHNAYFFFCVFVGVITFSVVSYFFYANGQIRHYTLWGREYEVHEVIEKFDEGEKIMINDIGWDYLIGAYRGNRRYAAEWNWPLKEWVPRKEHLRLFDEEDVYKVVAEDIQGDRELVGAYNIEKIALVVSDLPEYEFPYQERLEEYFNVEWLSFEKKYSLKNKTLYIFKVVLDSED